MFNLAEPQRTDFDLSFMVAGFPVTVNPLFWVMGAIIGVLQARAFAGRPEAFIPVIIAVWILVIFVAIILHELGHAVVMRYYGESARIVLYLMGGLAISEGMRSFLTQSPVRTNQQQIIVSAAGPGAGFLFAVLIVGLVFVFGGQITFDFQYVLPSWQIEIVRGEHVADTIDRNSRMLYLDEMINAALWVNIYWGLLNLLPVFPLDGGQIARAIFLETDPWNGLIRSLWVSLIAAVVVAVFGVMNDRIYLGFMFGSMAFSSWQMIQQAKGGGGFGGRPW